MYPTTSSISIVTSSTVKDLTKMILLVLLFNFVCLQHIADGAIQPKDCVSAANNDTRSIKVEVGSTGCCIYTGYLSDIVECCNDQLYLTGSHHCSGGRIEPSELPSPEGLLNPRQQAIKNFKQSDTAASWGSEWRASNHKDATWLVIGGVYNLVVGMKRLPRMAYISSPRVKVRVAACVTFHYRIDAADPTSISVQVYMHPAAGASERIWQAVGDGNGWKIGSVDLTPHAHRVSFIIELNTRAHITIKDIELRPSHCTVSVDDYEGINCDFDSGNLCDWKQDGEDDFDWKLKSGRARSFAGLGGFTTGPDDDHTGGGSYLYMASNERDEGDRARLVSPVITRKPGTDLCFSLWYHIKGYDTGLLSIIAVNTEGDEETIWSRSVLDYDESTDWLRADVDLSHEHFRIVIEATAKSYFSDIALDDVRMYETRCGGLAGPGWVREDSGKSLLTPDKPSLSPPVAYSPPIMQHQGLLTPTLNSAQGETPRIIIAIDTTIGCPSETNERHKHFDTGSFVTQMVVDSPSCPVTLVGYAGWHRVLYHGVARGAAGRVGPTCGVQNATSYISKLFDFISSYIVQDPANRDYGGVVVVLVRDLGRYEEAWRDMAESYMTSRKWGLRVLAVGWGSKNELNNRFKGSLSMLACGHPIHHLCSGIFFTNDLGVDLRESFRTACNGHRAS